MNEITHSVLDDHLDKLVSNPKTVLNETWLSKEEKRELLAFWLSDIHAVPDRPALRRLKSGVVFNVDDLSEALKALDDVAPRPYANVVPFRRRNSPGGGSDDPAPTSSRLRPLPPPVVIDARASAAVHPVRRCLR
jgi:hypothetical protein